MTRTFDGNRTPARRVVITALAVAASLLTLSAPVAPAAPGNGPGDEPFPPNVPSDHYPSLELPSLQASQNPVVFYGNESEKTIELTWAPYPWGPVQFRFKAIDGGPQHAGYHPPIDPDVTNPKALFDVKYGRVYHVWLKTPYPGEKVGPTLTITTVKIGPASSDPKPPRIQQLDPGIGDRNTPRDRTPGASPRAIS